MKSIIKFAVSNPVTICMLVLAILLLGKISYDQLAVDLLPDLNNPRLFIDDINVFDTAVGLNHIFRYDDSTVRLIHHDISFDKHAGTEFQTVILYQYLPFESTGFGTDGDSAE